MAKSHDDALKFLSKFKWRVFFIGIGTVSVLSPLYFYLSGKDETAGFWQRISDGFYAQRTDLLLTFISAIVISAATFVCFGFINDYEENTKKKMLLDEIKNIHLDYLNDLKHMDMEIGLKIATHYIGKAQKSIYVVGTAKSEHQPEYVEEAGKKGAKKDPGKQKPTFIDDYMKATEDVLKANHTLNYKRITKFTMRQSLRNHLQQCLTVNDTLDKDDYRASVILMDDFMTANTFLVIDDSFLFISPTAGDIKLETNHCHISTDEKIVKLYRAHFENMYHKAKVTFPEIISTNDLNKESVQHFLEIRQSTNQMVGVINRIMKNAEKWQLNYAKKLVLEADEKLQMIDGKAFQVDHKSAYSNLLPLVRFFLKEMVEGDLYQTVSFVSFWENISNKEANAFEAANKDALKRATLHRTLVIELEKLKGGANFSNKYQEMAEKTIRTNLSWAEEFETNYKFRILFVDREYGELFDFAKITLSRDIVLLKPDDIYNPNRTEVFHLKGDAEQFEIQLSAVEEKIKSYDKKLKNPQTAPQIKGFLSQINNTIDWKKYLGE